MRVKRSGKRILSLLLTAFCALALTVPALAEEGVDLTGTGSIHVEIRSYGTEESVGGGSLNLYQVAEIISVTGKGEYRYTDAFAGCDEALLDSDTLEQAGTADVFADRVSAQGIAATETKEVSSLGEVLFSDLSVGLYLITQDTPADGYNPINAFLVTVPIDEEGTFVYDVDATPKTSLATKSRITFYLADFATEDPLSATFTLTNENGQYAKAQETLANAWDPFVVTAYAAEEAGMASWTDTESSFTLPVSGITFDGITEGTYTLTETAAPDGYLLPEESVTLDVDADGNVTVTDTPYYENEPLAISSGSAWDGVVTVKNVKTETATVKSGNPDSGTGGTGGSGTSGTSGSGNAKTGDYNYFFYGILIICAVVAIVIVLRRRANRTAR